MNILAIDNGSYSIKFYEVKSERRSFVLQEKHEIIIDEMRVHYPNIQNINELQREIVANFLQKKGMETKIIFQLPNEYVTTRYLELPVNSRAKAEQMVPFQLDDNLPYSLSHAHFASSFIKKSQSFSVLANIIQESEFKNYYQFFDGKNALPHIITSEVAIYQSMIEYLKINENCLIVDLGHKTSKLYVVHNRQIVSNQLNYVAGLHLNEVIANTYQLSMDNAAIHKHENGFFLNQSMYDDVSPDQKEFGLLMKQSMIPLLQDIKRLEIGFRVKFGNPITKIYITGGTSLFNNIDGFLQEETGILVSRLPVLGDIKNDFSTNSIVENVAKMMILAQKNKSPLINFLHGKFPTMANTFISLHSAVFIGVRAWSLAILLILGLLAEKYVFLNREMLTVDKKIDTIIKSPTLSLSKVQKNSFKKNPDKFLSYLRKKSQTIKQEVSTILSAEKINALKPLATLSQIIGANSEISLVEFIHINGTSKGKFQSENVGLLKTLNENLKKSTLNDIESKIDESQKTITFSFSE